MTVQELTDDLAKYPGYSTLLVWDKEKGDYRFLNRWEIAVVVNLTVEKEVWYKEEGKDDGKGIED